MNAGLVMMLLLQEYLAIALTFPAIMFPLRHKMAALTTDMDRGQLVAMSVLWPLTVAHLVCQGIKDMHTDVSEGWFDDVHHDAEPSPRPEVTAGSSFDDRFDDEGDEFEYCDREEDGCGLRESGLDLLHAGGLGKNPIYIRSDGGWAIPGRNCDGSGYYDTTHFCKNCF